MWLHGIPERWTIPGRSLIDAFWTARQSILINETWLGRESCKIIRLLILEMFIYQAVQVLREKSPSTIEWDLIE